MSKGTGEQFLCNFTDTGLKGNRSVVVSFPFITRFVDWSNFSDFEH